MRLPGWLTGSVVGRLAIGLLDVLRQLPPEILALFSLARVLPGNDTLAGQLIGWTVVFVVLYEFSSVFTPSQLDLRERPRLYRLLFAAVSLGWAIAFARRLRPFSSEQAALLLGGFALGYCLSIVAFVAFFHYVTGWRLQDIDGRAVSLMDSFMPFVDMREEVADLVSLDGWWQHLGIGTWLVAFGTTFFLSCFLVGFVTAQFGRTFPIPDVLLLLTVLVEITSDSRSFRVPDLDRYVYVIVESATRNLKGAFLVLFAGTGILLSAGMTSVVLSNLDEWLGLLWTALGRPPLAVAAWDVVGLIVAFVASLGYLFWFWLRILARIPRFLDIWERDLSGRSGPTRPLGFTLPPMLVVLALVPLARRIGTLTDPLLPAYALVWPLLLAGLLGCVIATARTRTQTPVREDRAIGLGVMIQWTGIVLVGHWNQILDGRVLEVVFQPAILLFAALTGTIYLPNLIRIEAQSEGWRQYAGVAFLATLGGVVLVLAPFYHGSGSIALWSLGFVCIAGALLIGTVRYLERR